MIVVQVREDQGLDVGGVDAVERELRRQRLLRAAGVRTEPVDVHRAPRIAHAAVDDDRALLGIENEKAQDRH